MERRPSYLAAFGWIVAGVTGAVLAAVVVDRLALQPSEFVASAAAAAVLALVFARRPADGIGAFLLFLLFADNWEYWLGLDLRLADEGAVVLFGMVGLLSRYVPSHRPRFGLKEAALAVVLATGVASSVINDVPLSVWGPATILLFKAIVFFYLVSWLRLSIEDVERVGLVIGSVALVILGLGFVEFFDPPRFQQFFGLPPLEQERGDITVTRSLFLHPSLYGWLTVSVSLFLYARFIVIRSWWALPLALLFNVGTILSTRRTPLIGLVAALAVGLMWQVRRWASARTLITVWAPVAGAVLVLVLVFLPALARIYDYTTEEYAAPPHVIDEILSPNPDAAVIATAQPRIALYVGSVAIARDHVPLGAGLGRYGSHMSRVEYSPVYGQYGLDQVTGLQPTDGSAITDTFWPMLLGETGIIGMIAFGVFIGALFVELWQGAGDGGIPRSRVLALGALLLFVESLVGSSSSATYVAPPVAYFLFAAVGASLAVSARRP
ncbi:MAG: O-antigen ligase family protein [Chloroflexota bacterium]